MTTQVLEGGKVVDRTGAMGRLRSVYCRDPDGNLIEYVEPTPLLFSLPKRASRGGLLFFAHQSFQGLELRVRDSSSSSSRRVLFLQDVQSRLHLDGRPETLGDLGSEEASDIVVDTMECLQDSMRRF